MEGGVPEANSFHSQPDGVSYNQIPRWPGRAQERVRPLLLLTVGSLLMSLANENASGQVRETISWGDALLCTVSSFES